MQVKAFGTSLRCRPVDAEDMPLHRYPSTATPSFYVPLPLVKTEDDVIYRPNLPSFENKYGQVLNQRDSGAFAFNIYFILIDKSYLYIRTFDFLLNGPLHETTSCAHFLCN